MHYTPRPIGWSLDLATPSDQPEVVTPPPSAQDDTLRNVVEILLAGYAIEKTAKLLLAIYPGIPLDIWKAVLHSVGTSGHRAKAKLARHELHGTPGAKVATGAARSEVYYRAAYVMRAAERVHADVQSGMPIGAALADEARVLKTHQAARNNRINAAARTADAATNFGDLLGWYLDPLLQNEPECIAADGNNFRASEGTVIGFPGSVHLHCGCKAGPPIAGAGMVNDAIAAAHDVIFATPRRYGLKATG